MPPEQFRAVCEAWTANSGRERTTTLIYSVGWTQHSVGAQYIRAGSIVQLLLGNIGRPGGGILALRGHASIQGSTDIPTLFNLLPGYLPMPSPGTPTSRRIRRRRSAAASRRASGTPPTRTWSRCSRSTGASTPPPTTTSASTTCRASTATTASTAPRMDMVDGQGPRLLPASARTRRSARRTGRLHAARDGQARLDGRPRPRDDRDRHVLEGRAGGRDRRDRAREVPHRGVLLPRRVARGEGGHVHPDPADAAVAGEGRRTERRPALGPVVLLPPRPDASGSGSRARPTSATGRSSSWTGPARARRPRRGASRTPRTCCAGSTATTWTPASSSPTTASSRPTAPRRGLLDLRGGVRGRGEPAPPRHGDGPDGKWGWAGRWTAGCSTTGPRPIRPASRGASARSSSGGTTDAGALDGRRHPRLPDDLAARPRPAAGRRRRRPRCAATTRSSCRPTARPGCSRPTAWSTGRCRRTTSPTSRRCATRSTASGQARPGTAYEHPRQPGQPRAERPCSRSCSPRPG